MHDSSFLQTTIDLAKRYGIPHSLLSPSELATRFPQFTGLAPDEVAYFEPSAGFVRPEACVRAQLAEAERLGARVVRDAVVTDVSRGEVRTSTETFKAAHIVVSAGAWTAKLLGAAIAPRLRVTRQTLHWFAADEPSLYAPDRFPIFIRIHGPNEGDSYYGFPTPRGGHGVKVATESFDVTANPDAAPSAPEDSDTFYDKHIAGLLRGVQRRRLAATTCLYTNTRASRFIIAAAPVSVRTSQQSYPPAAATASNTPPASASWSWHAIADGTRPYPGIRFERQRRVAVNFLPRRFGYTPLMRAVLTISVLLIVACGDIGEGYVARPAHR